RAPRRTAPNRGRPREGAREARPRAVLRSRRLARHRAHGRRRSRARRPRGARGAGADRGLVMISSEDEDVNCTCGAPALTVSLYTGEHEAGTCAECDALEIRRTG